MYNVNVCARVQLTIWLGEENVSIIAHFGTCTNSKVAFSWLQTKNKIRFRVWLNHRDTLKVANSQVHRINQKYKKSMFIFRRSVCLARRISFFVSSFDVPLSAC